MRRALTAEYVRARLGYDPETGTATWLPLPGDEHAVTRWNAKWAGKPVGSFDADGYRRVKLLGDSFLLHRVIWLHVTGCWPKNEIDHHDLNKANNRWVNLRAATPAQNRTNRVAQRNNRLGVKGVTQTRSGKYAAHISLRAGEKKKLLHLGTFGSLDEAKSAYAEHAVRTHGEFARVN